MKKKTFQISIPKPCDQKFKDMTPREGGRHCTQCDKVIVDFSRSSDKEIAALVKSNKGKICGRFHRTQLNRNINWRTPKVNSTRGKAAGLLLATLLNSGMLDAQDTSPNPLQIIENQSVKSNKKTPVDDFLEKSKQEKVVIKGKVMDEEYMEELIGATVIIKGTNIGTATDIDGNFELNITLEELKNGVVLQVSYTGFNTKEIDYNYDRHLSNEPILMNMNSVGIILMGEMICVSSTNYDPMKLPHWEPEGNWLLDIESGIKNLINKFKRKKEERKKRKAQKAIDKKSNEIVERPIDTNNNQLTISPINKNITSPSFKLNNTFPNPFSNEIKLEIESTKDQIVEMQLVDVNGQLVYFLNKNLEKGKETITINLQNFNLPDGNYFLQIKEEDKKIEIRNLIKITPE